MNLFRVVDVGLLSRYTNMEIENRTKFHVAEIKSALQKSKCQNLSTLGNDINDNNNQDFS